MEKLNQINHSNGFLYGYFILIVVALVVIEILYIKFVKKQKYDFGSTVGSFGVAIGNLLLRPLSIGFTTFIFTFFERFALFHFKIDNILVWVAGFFAFEFCYYWMHRLHHTIRFMWASHAVHHSANVYSFPAAIRLGWLSIVSLGWAFYLPLVLIGFPSVMIGALLTFNLAYQFILHTEISPKWGVLEYFLNTPNHHRIHHASNPQYIDKNYGGTLIIYDYLFGTFAKDDGNEMVKFGLTQPINSINPFVIALREYWLIIKDCSKANKLGEVLKILISKP